MIQINPELCLSKRPTRYPTRDNGWVLHHIVALILFFKSIYISSAGITRNTIYAPPFPKIRGLCRKLNYSCWLTHYIRTYVTEVLDLGLYTEHEKEIYLLSWKTYLKSYLSVTFIMLEIWARTQIRNCIEQKYKYMTRSGQVNQYMSQASTHVNISDILKIKHVPGCGKAIL